VDIVAPWPALSRGSRRRSSVRPTTKGDHKGANHENEDGPHRPIVRPCAFTYKATTQRANSEREMLRPRSRFRVTLKNGLPGRRELLIEWDALASVGHSPDVIKAQRARAAGVDGVTGVLSATCRDTAY